MPLCKQAGSPRVPSTAAGSSLVLHMGTEVQARPVSGSTPRSNGTTPGGQAWADPVADVLDWLGRFDPHDERSTGSTHVPGENLEDAWVQDEVCDEASQNEAGQRAMATPGRAQLPRHIGSPVCKPGRPSSSERGAWLLHPRPEAEPPLPIPGKPMAPPLSAMDDPPAKREGHKCSSSCSSCSLLGRRCCPEANEKRSGRDLFEEEEEEEWELRQQKSGTVGRLVVYHDGESPSEDVVLRGGGRRRHVVVAEGGLAARVGVKAGDRLVSIDGKKDFLGLPAETVRQRLRAPTVLVFLGFVGKLQAEVRLTCAPHVCGISTRQEVIKGSNLAPLQLCEERIIDAGVASLFLTITAGEDLQRELKRTSWRDGVVGLTAPTEEEAAAARAQAADAAQLPLFELQRWEARSLVQRAVRRLEMKEILARPTSVEAAAVTPIRQGTESSVRSTLTSVASGEKIPVVPPLELDDPGTLSNLDMATLAPRRMAREDI